jgi:hypothetical protein
MARAADMLNAHPITPEVPREEIAACIDTLIACSQNCSACADACLAQPDVAAFISCIRSNQDCADVCDVTARYLTRQTAIDWQLGVSLLDTCLYALDLSIEACEPHADTHEHCRICIQACEAASEACRAVLAAIPDAPDVY